MTIKFKKSDIELPPPFKFSSKLIFQVRKWLGSDGIGFFSEMKKEYGTVSPVFMEGKIPHAVHFREGMQVRNFLRGLSECADWSNDDFDNQWAYLIDKTIEEKQDGRDTRSWSAGIGLHHFR